MDHEYFLLLGSNIGDRRELLSQARSAIGRQIGAIHAQSALYETEPWGFKDQAGFYNQAISVHSRLAPDEVLDVILQIESDMGRHREQQWGPREIDIDLILWSGGSFQSEKLSVPHPHMHERSFVLIPLMEIAGDVIHPIFHKTVESLYLDLRDDSEVILLED